MIPVVLGERNTLFELNHINNFNGVSDVKNDIPPRSAESPEVSARRLGRAARAFDALGVDFVFLLYPTKAWLLPQDVPQSFLLPGGHARAEAGLAHFIAELRKNDVPLVDGVAEAKDFANLNPGVPMWNRGSAHWTEALACHVNQQVMRVARAQAMKRRGEVGEPDPGMRCKLLPPAEPTGSDVDLATLINVWDSSRFNDPVRPVSVGRAARGGPSRVLIIGTSYSNPLKRFIARSGLGRSRSAAYYRSFHRNGLRLPDDFAGQKLVIFEQWQWSYLTVNIQEFLDDMERETPEFAEAMRRTD
ncbi:MAG: hypothetical protein QM756_24660 [Polyangiaceae bacterium]